MTAVGSPTIGTTVILDAAAEGALALPGLVALALPVLVALALPGLVADAVPAGCSASGARPALGGVEIVAALLAVAGACGLPVPRDAAGFGNPALAVPAVRPSRSIQPPAAASARSSSSTTRIKPRLRRGGIAAIESSPVSRGRCEVAGMLCAPTPFVGGMLAGMLAGRSADRGLLGDRWTLGARGNEGGAETGPLGWRAGPCALVRSPTGGIGWIGCPPVSIFSVGASRLWAPDNLAPHPPQNRESGSFWVLQLGQRIPPARVTQLAGSRSLMRGCYDATAPPPRREQRRIRHAPCGTVVVTG